MEKMHGNSNNRAMMKDFLIVSIKNVTYAKLIKKSYLCMFEAAKVYAALI